MKEIYTIFNFADFTSVSYTTLIDVSREMGI